MPPVTAVVWPLGSASVIDVPDGVRVDVRAGRVVDGDAVAQLLLPRRVARGGVGRVVDVVEHVANDHVVAPPVDAYPRRALALREVLELESFDDHVRGALHADAERPRGRSVDDRPPRSPALLRATFEHDGLRRGAARREGDRPFVQDASLQQHDVSGGQAGRGRRASGVGVTRSVLERGRLRLAVGGVGPAHEVDVVGRGPDRQRLQGRAGRLHRGRPDGARAGVVWRRRAGLRGWGRPRVARGKHPAVGDRGRVGRARVAPAAPARGGGRAGEHASQG